jgi:hypothetical protein
LVIFSHLSEVTEISPAVEDPGYIRFKNIPHPGRDARKLRIWVMSGIIANVLSCGSSIPAGIGYFFVLVSQGLRPRANFCDPYRDL